MYRRNLLVLLLCLTICIPVLAEDVPYIFSPGEPANAAEVNANFSTLAAQIEQLQSQIAELSGAPTMAGLAGTYDFFELGVSLRQHTIGFGFDVDTSKGSGTVVLNADGTGTLNISENERYLSISSQTRNDPNAGDIETTSLQLTPEAFGDNTSLTWTLSGNIVSLTIPGEGVTTLRVGGGNILVTNETDDAAHYTLVIAVRR